MNINGLLSHIVTTCGSTPAINDLIKGRIFPDQAPEGTPNPCIIYQLLNDQFDEVLDSGAASSGGYSIQFRAYASTRSQANTLRENLRLVFQGMARTPLSAGAIEGSSFGGYTDTHETNAKLDDFGALAVAVFHLSSE